MLRQLIDWNRRRKQWNADHVAAWRGISDHDQSGLSPFQYRCEQRLVDALRVAGYIVANRQIKGPEGARYISGSVVHGPVTFWLHDDTVGYDVGAASRRFEEWDYRTPDELIEDFCRLLIEAVRAAA